MRRAATLRAAIMGTLLMVGSACSDDGSQATPSPAPVISVAPPRQPARRPDYVVPTQRGEVVGHVRIADPAALLAKLESVVPSGIADSLAIPALRERLLRDASPTTAAVIRDIDFGPSVACVLLDPAKRDVPIACVFGYSGGLPQLRTDLGNDGVHADGEAMLHLERDGVGWFFDEIGDRIVVAWEKDAFESCGDYLGALANPGGARDVEIILHTAHAAKAYRSELSALIIAASIAAETASEIVPSPEAREAFSALRPQFTELALDSLDELAGLAVQAERVELSATVAPTKIALGVRVVPASGSAVDRWISATPGLESGVWEWLPNGTWFVSATRKHPAGTLRPRWHALHWRVFAHFFAAFIERDVSALDEAADALSTAQAETYGDWTLVSAFNSPATLGGAMLVRPKNVGIDARETWLQLVEAATPRALFGDALGRTVEETVRWKVVRAAATVEGLTVDEWRLSATPGLLNRLAKSVGPHGVGAEIIEALKKRETLLAVQRFELDGAVVFTFAPGGGEAYARKIVRAKHGEGRLIRTGIDTIVGDRGVVQRVVAFSGFDLVRALREMAPPDLRAGLPAVMGQNLADAYYTETVTEDGARVHEVVISTFVFDALREAMRSNGAPVRDDSTPPQ
ncbi:MAG: hypothetical protein JKY37_26600 [Nannocystaceae bacterium]|nr:hypothetical protein [Nannocystaceae bacterium]